MVNLGEKEVKKQLFPKQGKMLGFFTSHSWEYVGESWEKHVTETGNYCEKKKVNQCFPIVGK